jgi:NADPH:quinone reductase-like Zn-dependent oxidoreductase
MKIGPGVDLVAAGGAPLAALTAYQLLKGLALEGRHLLVLGASGGVGHFAVQIGVLLGCRVTAVASSRNQDFLKSLGAHAVLAYDAPDFADQLTRCDIYFDAVAKESPSSVSRILNKGSCFLSTLPNPLHFMQAMFGGLKYRGAMVKSNPADLELLAEWLQSGRLKVHIDRKFALAEAADAHRASESGRTRGKIILLP